MVETGPVRDIGMDDAASVFARPPPFHVARNFLGDALVERLLGFAMANEDRFEPTRVARGDLDPTIRISRGLRDLRAIRPDIAPPLKAVLPVALMKLGIGPFEPAKLELQFVAHCDGAFYAHHIDTITTSQERSTDRVISGVYYFSALPKAFTGGALRLYSIAPAEAGGVFVDIQPDRDTLVLFPSWMPHEVLPVTCESGRFIDSRFAINCWFCRARASLGPDATAAGD
jgi:SM-20-related protein